MRKSEITIQLIELSIWAKQLGFPQKVEVGDWYEINGKPVLCNYAHGTLRGFKPEEHSLILSFPNCLSWLEDNNRGEMIGLDLNNFIHGHWIMGIKTKTYRGKNIHEVGAKAVVMKLEEKNA